MVLLDGKYVQEDIIDPSLHKFIGTFREPRPPIIGTCYYFQCSCGDKLYIAGEEFTHWQKGCFDVPQYTTIMDGK